MFNYKDQVGHIIPLKKRAEPDLAYWCAVCRVTHNAQDLTFIGEDVSAPDDPHAAKRDILNSALAAVCGDRALNYGKPEANFARIALLWNAYVHIRAKDQGVEEAKLAFTEWDVANLMILMKVARTMNQPNHKDSWVDIAGYAACAYDITHDMK